MDQRRGAPGILKWAFVCLCTMYILGYHGVLQIQATDDTQIVRLKLMHRNSHGSPFRNASESRLETVTSLLRHDKLRLAAFVESILRSSSSSSHIRPAKRSHYFAHGRVRGGLGGAAIGTPIFSGASVNSGQYFVDLEIGTPSKHFLLIADTGSDLMWVNCHYQHPGSSRRRRSRRRKPVSNNRALKAYASSTFHPISCVSEECQMVPGPSSCSLLRPTNCIYKYTYADLSTTSGVFAYDTATMNSANSSLPATRVPNVVFGCSTERHGHSFDGADGIMGLGQGQISFSSQIGSTYDNYKFSYCLVDHLNAPSTHNYLVFGNRNLQDKVRATLRYTPLLKDPRVPDTFYYVGIEGVNVNGIRLPIPPVAWSIGDNGTGGTIVDSGTTLTYVAGSAYTVLFAVFDRLVRYPRVFMNPFDLCFNSSAISNPRLPEFSIDFYGGASFRPPVDNYFIAAADGVTCLSILGTSGVNVIGNIMQQNFVMEFDRHHSILGFARTDCSRD